MASATTVQNIPIDQLHPSPTNPRKYFDEAKLEELAVSVKSEGILQPIVARPVKGKTPYQIVFGHRRWFAAQRAGLATVPVIVRELDDTTAATDQVIENLQRQDVTALEEADGYAQLRAKGLSADDIAKRTGVSKAQVYARLKLAQLAEPARQLLADGTIDASGAQFVARLTPAMQARAAEALRSELPDAKDQDVDPEELKLHHDDVERVLNWKLRRYLEEADWKLDATLVDGKESLPACVKCPKNLRNDPDKKSNADVCTDLDCWDRKALVVLRTRVASGEGTELPAAQATGVFSPHGRVLSASPYRSLADSLGHEHDYRPLGEVLKKAKIKLPTFLTTFGGRVHALVDAKAAKAALANVKPKEKAAPGKSTPSAPPAIRKNQDEQHGRIRRIAAVASKVKTLPPFVVDRFFDDATNDASDELLLAFGLNTKHPDWSKVPAEKKLAFVLAQAVEWSHNPVTQKAVDAWLKELKAPTVAELDKAAKKAAPVATGKTARPVSARPAKKPAPKKKAATKAKPAKKAAKKK